MHLFGGWIAWGVVAAVAEGVPSPTTGRPTTPRRTITSISPSTPTVVPATSKISLPTTTSAPSMRPTTAVGITARPKMTIAPTIATTTVTTSIPARNATSSPTVSRISPPPSRIGIIVLGTVGTCIALVFALWVCKVARARRRRFVQFMDSARPHAESPADPLAISSSLQPLVTPYSVVVATGQCRQSQHSPRSPPSSIPTGETLDCTPCPLCGSPMTYRPTTSTASTMNHLVSRSRLSPSCIDRHNRVVHQLQRNSGRDPPNPSAFSIWDHRRGHSLPPSLVCEGCYGIGTDTTLSIRERAAKASGAPQAFSDAKHRLMMELRDLLNELR
ncbi:hypothetical protein H257_11755 [Aphanomyces astaci]|uniref:Uncharacterized protein n=1 Tax=Aphanomyces astaci TaxID=112090 RepID=W4G1S2_APHAT|nr:hypothetical protein H257_11755 [Aphanomyces astaci]ETV73652.1 hypothetical protein H257_11755 [Aphanomyces astaci]|eukprot:XP_009837078.1 hypothetical protein H257_11755 [Aphanomyces astaci]